MPPKWKADGKFYNRSSLDSNSLASINSQKEQQPVFMSLLTEIHNISILKKQKMKEVKPLDLTEKLLEIQGDRKTC